MNTLSKKKASAIAFFLMMTITFSAIPLTLAHDPAWTISTYTYMSVAPNPVGINQIAYVNVWIDKVPPTATDVYGVRWHGITVEVKKPNGNSETLGPFSSDAVGGVWTTYTPDQIGTYAFKASFPGQVVKEENPPPFPVAFPIGFDFINDTYTGSTSETVQLTVQENPVQTAYPANPLPTEYWTRPINSMNRNWYTIGGNWLGLKPAYFGYTGMYDATGNFNPYTTAPNSAHVIWTRPIAFGGQIGGNFSESETAIYATGTAYEAKFNPVIIQGTLYYTEYPGASTNPGYLNAVDLRTGETLWSKPMNGPDQTLKCGMIYNFKTGNQYGANAYLFTANSLATVYGMGFVITTEAPKWSMYDAKTGNWILDIANTGSASQLFVELGFISGENGEILSFTVANGMLTMWNSSKCLLAAQANSIFTIGPVSAFWRPPQGATIEWSGGNQWSVPVATNISGVPINPPLAPIAISDNVILMTSIDTSTPGWFQPGWRVDAGYSTVDGHLLWGPINRTLTPWTGKGKNVLAREGVYAVWDKNLRTWEGFSIKTGQKLWTTEPKNSSWSFYDAYGSGVIAYGSLYSWGMGGDVYCFDLQTGKEKWYWTAGSSGVDSPYGVWPLGSFFDSYILADGKLYVRSGHDYTPPVFKGAKLYCLNTTTGEEIWSSLSFNIAGSPACADGYMLWDNGYDNQIYAYGKGPSATTVEAPLSASKLGDSIVIQGTVMDKSPDTEDSALTSRFPNGVPAMSDDSQSAWMEYLYQQQPMPTDATGVTVTIDVIDSNHNYRNIGTATTNTGGFYSLDWKPDIPGKYTVVATFFGSESYYASHAYAAFVVDEPSSEATPQPTQAPASLADQYFLPGIGAVIAAVAIVGALMLLQLRKK